MSNTDFLGRAIDVIKKAIEHDTAGDYEKAYALYYQARECPPLGYFGCLGMFAEALGMSS
jgi:hypothetical protein